MWMTSLLTKWLFALLAIVIATNILTVKLWRNCADGRATERAEWAEKVKNAQAALAAEQQRSLIALEKTKDEAKRNEVLSNKNAVNNYRRRYGEPAACGVRDLPAAATAGAVQTGGAAYFNGLHLPKPLAAPGDAFVTACGKDAGMIELWKRWARFNKLPVEGE